MSGHLPDIDAAALSLNFLLDRQFANLSLFSIISDDHGRSLIEVRVRHDRRRQVGSVRIRC